MHKNPDEFEKYNYLCVTGAVESVGDEELVHEMLIMLNSSIEQDWAEFERYFNANQYTLAANMLHGMKGTIPIFSNKKTKEAIQKTESKLNSVTDEFEINKAMRELRFQMMGFMFELKRWVNSQIQ